MKRLSWTLASYELPDFKIYDKTTHISSQQVPIVSPPGDNTFFIGTTNGGSEKLLCYHISGGQYIVISYNYSATRLFQDVISNDIYEPQKVGNYSNDVLIDDNPVSVPTINSDMTVT